MITLYHAQRARSARVIWLLEELAVPYELVTLPFTPAALKAPEHLARHPLGQIPALRDGDVHMFESGAILTYILEKYGHDRLAPAPGTPERAEYLTWFHFGEASLAVHTSLIVAERFGKGGEPASEATLATARRHLHDAVAAVDRQLTGREYILASGFGAADLMVSYGLIMARIVRELPAEFTNVASYLARLKERPSYARAWA